MKELKDLIYKNISLSDFDQKFDSIEGIKEKFAFLNNYILSLGMDKINENEDTMVADHDLHDMVAHARIKFIEAIVKEKEAYEIKNKTKLPQDVFDPNDKKRSLDVTYAKFISEPMDYVEKNAMHRKDQVKIDDNDPNKDEIKYYKMNLSRLIIYAREPIDFDEYGNDFAIKDFTHRIGKELYNKMYTSPNEFLDRNKGGFFERLFKTTSSEYQEFEETYRAFNDKENPAYGDLDRLETVTLNYLKYKMPNYKGGSELPKQEDINKLSGTSRKRVESLVSVLKTIRLEKELSNVLDQADDKMENQDDFQNNLDKNLNDNHNLNNNLEEIKNDLSIEENENEIDTSNNI